MKTVKIGKFHILELINSGSWISDIVHMSVHNQSCMCL